MIVPSRRIALAAAVVAALAAPALAQEAAAPAAKPKKVVKTDAEWRKQLTREQYYITREAGTEQAGTGKLLHNKAKGVYECVGCSTPLFSSRTKFESGTGWPSFYAPYDKANIRTDTDYKMGYARTEVRCNVCDAHLGHVFDDAYTMPTGLRFCMNSAALKFVKDTPPAKPDDKAKAEPKPETKATEPAAPK